jgi:hypothetical protein
MTWQSERVQTVKQYVLLGVVTILVITGIVFAVRPVHKYSIDCGSVLVRSDVEVVGPVGTDSRPCRGAHDGDAQLAVSLLAIASVVAMASMYASTFRKAPTRR